MARKTLSIICIMFVVCGLAAGSAWAAKLKVGMVFDVGGKGDQSFNDSAYRGLQWASNSTLSHWFFINKMLFALFAIGGFDRSCSFFMTNFQLPKNFF